MGRKRNRRPYLENVEITAFGSQGKAIGRVNEKVVFVPFAAPGDLADVQVTKKRRQYMEGRMEKIHRLSELRTTPFCEHFGTCGGCKWQHIPYEKQLEFKQQQVVDQLERIGKLDLPGVSPILGSEKKTRYRNKLEYSFSNKKWLTDYSKDLDFEDRDMNGLGFHMPGMFDRILDLNICYLQDDLSNSIRDFVKMQAEKYRYSFYDARRNEGLLRNLMVRNNQKGEWMVVLIMSEERQEAIENILGELRQQFPQVVSLMYIVNNKKNDSLEGLKAKLYSGLPYLTEELESIRYKIDPLSFFQTNTGQALKMYRKVREFAGITADDVVYDLYTGTGSIALFLAPQAARVIGIEYLPEAVNDAKLNMQWNNITNAEFVAGDMAEILTDEFVAEHGRPGVVITDPPRAGMHKDVVAQLLRISPRRMVYVSCNPATQARDVALMQEHYRVAKVQPVDMFPHTHHVENILLLENRAPSEKYGCL